ncbi:DinB family protein [Pedobacter cryoconitis]|uniref:DinB family protein n=1 Tax=Pedobacter cryoconitis TaxID=188932 RepID=A0A327SN26_9SPHI|nr:DinB family protein [Pedobacter cryoconitis]RAJ27097.1 DinB family protein [Pedobacter cryoconitis]
MRNSSVFSSLKDISANYYNFLRKVPEGQFQLTPPIGGWSYSEVYAHIFDISLLTLKEVDNCIKGEGKVKPTAFIVKVILFFGSFPPKAKYKVPKALAGRESKITKEAAAEFIEEFVEQLNMVYSQLHLADPALKTRHPRLGYLNASQWFRFMEIHLKHHLKQLKRIEKSF